MPAQQGLRLDEETPTTSGRHQPAQPGEHRPVRRPQNGPGDLAAQHGDLVAEHHDLDGQILLLAAREPNELEQTNEGHVQEGERHTPSSP
jgi:hypothetical protein